jgi:hypothetical protein
MTKNNIENKGIATFNAIINGAKWFLSMKPCASPAPVGGCAGGGVSANELSARLGATTPLGGAFGHGSLTLACTRFRRH